jgi:hypothetical protein
MFGEESEVKSVSDTVFEMSVNDNVAEVNLATMVSA